MLHDAHKPGFTLAELLIALALLGVIAAFTIPKVLQSSAEQEKVAKLRELASTLEQAWYNAKATNSVPAGSTLWSSTQGQLNAVLSSPNDQDGIGELYETTGSKCAELGYSDGGYHQFANGVVVMNMNGPAIPAAPASVQNTVLCIDLNGPASPNAIGQDVFWATFNPWGDFDTNSGDATYTAGENRKAFIWGTTSEPPREGGGTLIVLGEQSTPESFVGTWLAR